MEYFLCFLTLRILLQNVISVLSEKEGKKIRSPIKEKKERIRMTKQARTDPEGRQVHSLIVFTFQRRVTWGVLSHTLYLYSLPHTMNNKCTFEDRARNQIGFFQI